MKRKMEEMGNGNAGKTLLHPIRFVTTCNALLALHCFNSDHPCTRHHRAAADALADWFTKSISLLDWSKESQNHKS